VTTCHLLEEIQSTAMKWKQQEQADKRQWSADFSIKITVFFAYHIKATFSLNTADV